jgi:hypothetical protein
MRELKGAQWKINQAPIPWRERTNELGGSNIIVPRPMGAVKGSLGHSRKRRIGNASLAVLRDRKDLHQTTHIYWIVFLKSYSTISILVSSLFSRRSLRYTPRHEYPKRRWNMGADVVGDRTPELQGLQRSALSQQNVSLRRLV